MSKLALQVKPEIFISIDTFRSKKEYQLFINGYLEFLSKRIIKRIKYVVRHTLYNWSPLSKTWKEFKKAHNLSPRQWYASGELMKYVKFWHSTIDNCYYIGVDPRRLHRVYNKKGGVYSSKRTSTKLIDIVRRLEFGTTRIPARPLFRPVFREFKRDQEFHFQEYLKTIPKSKRKEWLS